MTFFNENSKFGRTQKKKIRIIMEEITWRRRKNKLSINRKRKQWKEFANLKGVALFSFK
jgi:hypothetical protein